MVSDSDRPEDETAGRLIGEARRSRAARQKEYREQALRIFPHICGRCGREFSGKKLRELTVHHKDHDHDNNPPDGSNWELLCLYCHDNEHQKYLDEGSVEKTRLEKGQMSSGMHRPFAGLQDLLRNKKK